MNSNKKTSVNYISYILKGQPEKYYKTHFPTCRTINYFLWLCSTKLIKHYLSSVKPNSNHPHTFWLYSPPISCTANQVKLLILPSPYQPIIEPSLQTLLPTYLTPSCAFSIFIFCCLVLKFYQKPMCVKVRLTSLCGLKVKVGVHVLHKSHYPYKLSNKN